MAYNFPIYKRGDTFVIHVRIFGKQIKRSLKTGDPVVAMARASHLMANFQKMKKLGPTHGWIANLATGEFSAEPGDDSEDLRRTMRTIAETGMVSRMADFQASLREAFANAVPSTPPAVEQRPCCTRGQECWGRLAVFAPPQVPKSGDWFLPT